MSKELDFIKENKMGFLSTIDENGKPRVRAFGILNAEEDKLTFLTSNKKEVFKQLKANPTVEWITMAKNASTLRVSGDIYFEKDREIINSMVATNPMIKKLYAGKEDEVEMFYVHNLEYNWFKMAKPFSKN